MLPTILLVDGAFRVQPGRWHSVAWLGRLAGTVERWLGASVVDPLPATFDLLADAVDDHLDTELLRTLARV